MNIAFYSHYFTPEIGAPPARIYDLAQQWLQAGHSVQVITCFPNHPTGELYPGYKGGRYMYENLEGIDVHRHWTFITPNKGFIKKTIGHISYLPSALLFSNPHLTRPDIVLASSPTFFAAMAAIRSGKRFKVPFIMEIRDLWPAIFVELGVLQNRMLIRWLEKIEMSLYACASRVVTVTEAFRHNLIQRGISPQKVDTIPNGANVNFWQPTQSSVTFRREIGINDHFVVLYIGAHGISHSLERILESADYLRSYLEIRFLFVGEGAKKEFLIQKAHELRLDNIQFFDPVDKEGVKNFYALADVCLVPLRNIPLFETFIPSKMFEIMAMERPIIGSVRGEAADILQRSKGAIVVEPEDSKAIAEAILHLFKNKERALEMGKRGRKFVVENYSRYALAKEYLEIIKEAIAEYNLKSY